MIFRNFNLLDPPFLARSAGGGGFVCADYTPGQATNLFTPYGGFVLILGQSDVDNLAGFDGVNGDLYIDCDTALLTDVAPLNGLLEITGSLNVSAQCLPEHIPMTGLRSVGADFQFAIHPSVTGVDNFGFNLTRVGGLLRLTGGGSLTSLSVGLFRRLYFATIFISQLDLTAVVDFNGLFPCFTGTIDFLPPSS